MDVNNKQPSLTQEDIERIQSLPEVNLEFCGGNEVRRGKIDQETGYFYPVKEDGSLTGKRVKLSNKSNPPEPLTKPEKKEKLKPDPKNNKSTTKTKDKTKSFISEKLRTIADKSKESNDGSEGFHFTLNKKIALIVIIAVVLIVVFASSFGVFRNSLSELGSGYKEHVSDEEGNYDQNPSQNLSLISVVQVTKDLVPGDVIVDQDIQECKISSSDYNLFSITDDSLYKWDSKQSLLGTYVTSYIPSGRYLTYGNVNASYVVPDTPWSQINESMATIICPLNNNVALNFGTITNVSIEITSLKESVDSSTTTTLGDLEHKTSIEQSYIVDQYKLSNIVVCDLLNSDKESLYPTYHSWTQIPAGEQENYIENAFSNDHTLYDQLSPRYVKLIVSKESSEELGNLETKNVNITFSKQFTYDSSSEEIKSFVAQAQSLRSIIEKAHIASLESKEE